jgi:hypothetical protein
MRAKDSQEKRSLALLESPGQVIRNKLIN